MTIECGKYMGDNDGTCPQLTCIRPPDHVGLCDNVNAWDNPPIRLLRGQTVIRENHHADVAHFKHIIVPETYRDNARGRAWHLGEVLAMGPPMQTPRGVEVAPGYSVGDTVIFHWGHHEKSFTREWIDGELAVWVPQSAIDAVVPMESKGRSGPVLPSVSP